MSNSASNGQRPIDRLRAAGARRRLTVPEWPGEDGTPLELYYTPFTNYDLELVMERAKRNYEFYPAILVHKAQSEDGTALFTWHDLPVLYREVSQEVIKTVVEQIRGLTPQQPGLPTVEAAEKNSGLIPPSISSSGSRSSSTNP